jgi:hypothetical protein
LQYCIDLSRIKTYCIKRVLSIAYSIRVRDLDTSFRFWNQAKTTDISSMPKETESWLVIMPSICRYLQECIVTIETSDSCSTSESLVIGSRSKRPSVKLCTVETTTAAKLPNSGTLNRPEVFQITSFSTVQ